MQAAQELAARGYYILRMGAAVSEPFTTDDPQIIDYAATHRDEFMDVYLSASCRIFLGPAAGIYAIARIFQRPIACVNYIPLSNAATWSGQRLLIPKTLRKRGSDHPISIPEMMELGAVSFSRGEEYEELDIEVVNNSPEEIAAVALELDDRLTDSWNADRNDEHLQQMFWSALGVPSDKNSVHARAGAAFLRSNQALLQHPRNPSSANKV